MKKIKGIVYIVVQRCKLEEGEAIEGAFTTERKAYDYIDAIEAKEPNDCCSFTVRPYLFDPDPESV